MQHYKYKRSIKKDIQSDVLFSCLLHGKNFLKYGNFFSKDSVRRPGSKKSLKLSRNKHKENKTMTKRLIALLLAMCLMLSLAACGSKNEETTTDEPAVEEEAPLPEEEDVVIESEVVDPEADVPAAPEEEQEPAVEMPTVDAEAAAWFKIGKGEHRSYILSPFLFNLYAE